MFGYLNKGNPRYIGDTEAQEIINAAIEKGYLEYREFETNARNNTKVVLANGKIVELDPDVASYGPKFGQVKWKDSESDTLAAFGLDQPSSIVTDNDPWTTVSKVPTVAAGSYGSNPYPAGDYQYAVTLYDPDTGEESKPATWDVTTLDHSTFPGSEVIEFSDFPDVSGYFPDRSNLQWRIYRRPQGGSEYLLVNGSTTISANSDYAGPYQDIIPDSELGIACDSLDNGVSYLRTQYSTAIALFNDHLFIIGSSGSQSRVNFSKQGEWWAFPAANELNLPGRFRAACELNEQLFLFSEEGCYVLYGDNINNFALKKTDYNLTEQDKIKPGFRTANAIGGKAIAPIIKEQTLSDGTAYNAAVYIIATNGAQTVTISEKIKDLFPLASEPDTVIAETNIIDNRFYAVKLIDAEATIEAGIDYSSAAAGDFEFITLVYDSYSQGWLLADDSETFTYRTKEFARPREVQFHKRIWVEAEGDFILQFIGDDQTVTELSLSFSSKQKKYYNIKPYRYDSFSFRFVGQSNCKIYDFGVDE